MTHERIQKQLSAWLDGELETSASSEVSSHLATCAACGREAARLRRLGSVLFRAAPPADPRSTEAFVARVMARVESESVSPWERFAARILAPAFAVALAGLLLTISLPAEDADAPLGVAMSVDTESLLGVAP